MKKQYFLILLIFALCGCELIVLTSKRKPVQELSQRNPTALFFLFKNELDSSDFKSASELMLQSNGSPYLAIQRYELFDDLKRLKRIIGSKPVTFCKADSLTPNTSRVNVEFDYIKNMSFMAQKINEYWFITGFNEQK